MKPGRLDESVRRQHRHIDVAAYDGVYVVGDVHGCPGRLDALLRELDVTEDDLVVFVGDLVRKGPDSRGAVERVMEMPNAVTVRGNNEEKLLRGEKHLPDLTEDHLDWIRSRPVAVTFADSLVVHGGVDPRKPLRAHTVDDLQNTRSLVPEGSYGDPPYWWDRYEGPERVFFGHTVLSRPVVRDRAVGLDTGCVYGGDLTAYDWRADEFVSVPGRAAEPRADEKILEPRRRVLAGQ